jgi:hypothetical protein
VDSTQRRFPARLSRSAALSASKANLSAARPDLSALDGTISFPELAIAFRGLELGQKQVSKIAIASGAATIQSLELTGSAGTIAAKGTVGLTGDRTLDVNVGGMLTPGAISLVTDRVRAEGDTSLQLQARGTVQESRPDRQGHTPQRHRGQRQPQRRGRERQRRHLARRQGDHARPVSRATSTGGELEGSGKVTLGEGGIADIDMARSHERLRLRRAARPCAASAMPTLQINKQDEGILSSAGGSRSLKAA